MIIDHRGEILSATYPHAKLDNDKKVLRLSTPTATDAGRLASSAKYGTRLKPIAELPVILHITVRATNQNAGVLKTSRPVQLDCS